MTREQAIAISRRCAKAKPESYYAEPFEPHEWVIDAVIAASMAACTICGGIEQGHTCCPPEVA